MNKKELIDITKKVNFKSCPRNINFHSHTIFSDGSLKPEDLLAQAHKNKLKILSITDHHTVDAHLYIEKYKLMDKYPINSFKLVPGIEINCLLKGCLVHVLGLGIDIHSKYLLPYVKGESPVGNDLQAISVCKAIKQSGGLSFLAHPARYRIAFNILIKEAISVGIDGIEVWYDYTLNKVWTPSIFICEKIDNLANKYKLLKSCGTDSHGYSLLGR
tara:strand:+ start:19519 stop:20166 length:648 start_codon:yes stop_codon:yes gene_type:complete